MKAFPFGEPTLDGVLKSCPEDFVVVEELGFEPGGQGEHLFLLVEKRGLSTPELVDRLADHYKIRARDIGYSGMKDKQALTRQWLSLPAAAESQLLPEDPDYRVIEQCLNQRKLRRGAHRANYFEIRLRQVTEFPAAARQQLEMIRAQGFANYFGDQRFGRQQDNVEQALKQLANPRLKRWRKGIYLSALRSELFNQILSARIAGGLWQEPVEGDVFMLSGRHSLFVEPIDDLIRERFAALEISSTGSLYGSGENLLTGSALELEREVVDANPEIVACLERHGAKRQMRALRVAASDFEYDYDEVQQTLEIKLRLPAGSYVTTLLDHVLRPTIN